MHDITLNDKLRPATKLHMLAVAECVAQQIRRRAFSHSTGLRLLADVRRPDGDPERIADAGLIYDAYTTGS